jgi:hypothetical protein
MMGFKVMGKRSEYCTYLVSDKTHDIYPHPKKGPKKQKDGWLAECAVVGVGETLNKQLNTPPVRNRRG